MVDQATSLATKTYDMNEKLQSYSLSDSCLIISLIKVW